MAEMCSKKRKPRMPAVPCVPPPPEAAGLHVAAGGDPDDSTEEVEVAREAEEDIGEPLQEEPDFGGGGDDFSLDEENDVVVEEEGEREDSATPADESEMLESDENARPNISAPLICLSFSASCFVNSATLSASLSISLLLSISYFSRF